MCKGCLMSFPCLHLNATIFVHKMNAENPIQNVNLRKVYFNSQSNWKTKCWNSGGSCCKYDTRFRKAFYFFYNFLFDLLEGKQIGYHSKVPFHVGGNKKGWQKISHSNYYFFHNNYFSSFMFFIQLSPLKRGTTNWVLYHVSISSIRVIPLISFPGSSFRNRLWNICVYSSNLWFISVGYCTSCARRIVAIKRYSNVDIYIFWGKQAVVIADREIAIPSHVGYLNVWKQEHLPAFVKVRLLLWAENWHKT